MTAQQPFEAYDQTTRKIFRFFSPSAVHCFAPDEHLQVSNGTVGDTMSAALRSDVRRHLSKAARRMVLPFKRVNQLDATSYSRNDSDSDVETNVFSKMGLEPILHPL